MKDKISLPVEIKDFFDKPGGRSLLVKGSAGTGKTTFALQLLEELADVDKSFYLSTRVSDSSLYIQFPWLQDKEMRARIVDSSRVLLEVLYPDEEDEQAGEEDVRVNSAREFLKSIKSDASAPITKVDRTWLSVLTERQRVPEIERIYDRIESILPEKAMLVVDSVEGVTQKYGLDMEDLIMTLQKDLAENSNTNILFVLEKAEAPDIEYLVDGVVSLSREEINGRRIRKVHLAKLRATAIRQPNYLMTLHNGRFRSFEPFAPDFTDINPWKAVDGPDGYYSTGIPDMDLLLGGGFRVGSYNVFDLDENMSIEEYFSIARPILLNFISHQRGVMATLTGGTHPEIVRNDFVRFIPPEDFDRYVRIMDYFSSSSDRRFVLPLARGKDEAIKAVKDAYRELIGEKHSPILEYTGFDTIEYLRGDTIAIKELLSAVSNIKNSRNLGIGVIKPGLKLTQEIMNMADSYFRILDIERTPCIYGIKPKTGIYAIVTDEEKGAPHVRLVPIQ